MSPPKDKDSDSYSEREAAERREAALKRMLATPHKPHKPIGRKASPAKRTAGKGRARAGKPRD